MVFTIYLSTHLSTYLSTVTLGSSQTARKCNWKRELAEDALRDGCTWRLYSSTLGGVFEDVFEDGRSGLARLAGDGAWE